MSRPRVITGQDDRGRPKAEWRDEPTTAPGYGFMEPAVSGEIERRQATPEEMAAAREREARPNHLTVASLANPALQVGHHAATTEEEIVTEAEIIEPVAEADVLADHLETLTLRADQAGEAWAALVQARETITSAERRWAEATSGLEVAWAEVGFEPLSPLAALEAKVLDAFVTDAERAAGWTTPTVEEIVAGADAFTQAAIAESQAAVAAPSLTAHQQRVLEATVRLDGDRKAVAKELDLTAAINVEFALEEIGRKGFLPASLIPKLPPRFARFEGVPDGH